MDCYDIVWIFCEATSQIRKHSRAWGSRFGRSSRSFMSSRAVLRLLSKVPSFIEQG